MRLLLAGFHLPSGSRPAAASPLRALRRRARRKDVVRNQTTKFVVQKALPKSFSKPSKINSRNIEEGGLWLAGQLMGLHVLLGSDNLDLQRGST